jgi:hypothetical protein
MKANRMRKRLAYLLRSWAMKLEPTVWDDVLNRIVIQVDQRASSPEHARRIMQEMDRQAARGGSVPRSTVK